MVPDFVTQHTARSFNGFAAATANEGVTNVRLAICAELTGDSVAIQDPRGQQLRHYRGVRVARQISLPGLASWR